MNSLPNILIDISIIGLLILGISLFRTPRGARYGNRIAALALGLAIAFVFYRHPILNAGVLAAALAAGGLVGSLIAMRVTMIQIPAMVAFQHGAGGIAACAIAFVELTRVSAPMNIVGEISGYLGLVIGAATFSGSMLASGKLAAKFKQAPTVLPKHNKILLLLMALIVGVCIVADSASGLMLSLILVLALVASAVLGLVFSIRIGGADMPVLISFLNATAGLAAAFCGIVIQNRLLIACGATVAASGSILTAVMCKAMNRKFVKVLSGSKPKVNVGAAPSITVSAPLQEKRAEKSPAELMAEAKEIINKAAKIIVIPGYGMALAKAQFKVAELARRLEKQGKDVSFAIHPVAGRMPGHMNVLLAEAEIDYDKLREMEDVNESFAKTDAVLIVGACDVVNSTAIKVPDTPISGMPILNAHEAKNVIVCNLDARPGYSGVPNSLYDEPTTILLFGDAGKTVSELLDSIPQ